MELILTVFYMRSKASHQAIQLYFARKFGKLEYDTKFGPKFPKKNAFKKNLYAIAQCHHRECSLS